MDTDILLGFASIRSPWCFRAFWRACSAGPSAIDVTASGRSSNDRMEAESAVPSQSFKDFPMNVRLAILLVAATACGFSASATFAQDAMASSSSTAMPHDSMKHDAMKADSMKHDSMKKDSMKKDSMKKDSMKKDSMKKDDTATHSGG
ncbi:MAG: pentapeptide MXKDX repeat protein [Rhodanobacter sp.]|jgi:pentapeptide MXKDX repeat protein|nr:pentapeptide MXKDX repeat protein [Rhodanobacter sp.]